MISNDLIQKIRKEISNSPTAYAYFFNKLNSPEWLKPLSDAGYFKHPTPLIRAGNFIQAPYWPESQYLVRIADQAQDEVLEIIKTNLQDIDNERIMDDVVQILLKVDVSKSVGFTDLVKKYVNASQFFLLEKSVSELIVKLADNNHAQAALTLAGTMLEVSEDPNKEVELKKDYVSIKPHVKYGDYEYSEILKKITPALAQSAPIKTTELYAELLQKTIDYEYTHFKGLDEDNNETRVENKTDDLSWIWRPKIEGDDEYHSENPQQSLTSALLDCVGVLLNDNSVDNAAKLATIKKLTDHKYYIFKRIVEYNLRTYKNTPVFKGLYTTLSKDKKLQTIIKHPIESHSGGVSYHPTNILEGGLSDADILEKLKTYEPKDTFLFDRESVAKELAGLIKADPARFASLLPDISTTKNEYLNESIEMFTEIVDDLTKDVVNVLLTSLTNIYKTGSKDKKERHDYYAWSKSNTLRLIEKLSSRKEDKTERLTLDNLSLATELTLLLCREELKNERDFDPVELSINSIRGNAMHGLIYLLAWMNRNKVDRKLYKPIFDELNWHLDVDNDPSPVIRAVYGWRFEFLYGTDADWAKSNISSIFSDDALGEVAFNAFIRFSRVHPDELELLGDVFTKQLQRLRKPPIEDGKSRHDALRNYVQHVALLYWHFSLDLSKDSLMSKLLDVSDVRYVKELTNFIGFRLYKKKADTDQVQLEKLMSLWRQIVELAKKDQTKTEALEEFGTWFASGKFDPRWSLEQLAYAAEKAKQIHLDFAALEHMETLAKDYPEESLKALNAMVDGARERWAIDSWSSHVKAILQTAYNSSDKSAREAAEALVNKLVAKGYLEHREIIQKAIQS